MFADTCRFGNNRDTDQIEVPEAAQLCIALYRDIEEKLKSSLGTKVTIAAKGDGMGKVEIDFYNQDDLQKIMDLLLAGN